VAIVIDDIDQALAFWRDGLGLEVSHIEDVPGQQSVVAFLPTDQGEIELVKPTDEESGVARFLDKRGPGVHHVCFQVEDLDASLETLQVKGIRLINAEPVIGAAGKRIAFIHPESTHGVLIELYEETEQEPQMSVDRARRLAERALAQSQVIAAGVLGFLHGLRSDGVGDPSPSERKN
jgi:methylmalonyl-CoA/ethylmalonyl-CoA epimerase